MNKYAQEKIAQHYYQLGMSLAMQNAGLGMSKTASRGKQLLAGLGGLGLGVAGAKAAPGLMGKLDAYMAERAMDAIRAGGPIMSHPDQLMSHLAQTQPAGLQDWLNQAATQAVERAKAMNMLESMKGFSGMGGDKLREGIQSIVD